MKSVRHPVVPMAAALMLAASASHAQVTLSGRIDLNVGKDIGSSLTRMGTGAMSHIAFSGSEDLGQGWKAGFKLQNRFNADSGTLNNPGAFLNTPADTFWSQESSLSLSSPWGSLTLGRQMNAALLSQVLADPWLWDNTTNMFVANTGLIGNLWYNNAITYAFSAGGASFAVQTAQKEGNPGWAGTALKNPYSLSLGYGDGPWSARIGLERPADGRSRWTTLLGSYQWGQAGLTGQIGNGTDHTGARVKTWTVSGTAALGTGQLRVAYGDYQRNGVKGSQKLSLGYYHPLSKRTSLYGNVANDRKAATEKTGYEVGLQHVF